MNSHLGSEFKGAQKKNPIFCSSNESFKVLQKNARVLIFGYFKQIFYNVGVCGVGKKKKKIAPFKTLEINNLISL